MHKDLKFIEQLNLWITPVWWGMTNLDNEAMYKKIKELENTTDSVYLSNLGGFQSATDRFDMMTTDPVFQPLRNLILHVIEKELNFKAKKFEVDRMWCNVNTRDDFNMIHSHGQFQFSGAYYVKAPKDSGQIVFRDPRPAAITNEFVTSQFNGGEVYRIEPEEGKLLIFPSYLDHMVMPSKSDDDRVSISWNIKATDD
mgnify:FL=1|tara:strand:+ start:579 stop:1172 length:594 start_codon:yes stop_codon:yes gene_type:complete